ncbi:hypothetical protein [Ilumatobacter sp.]|uniref:hypothetical protein n=1 Tax=Ilumatobacter sp. TaxID=1967498 RepID=UPI003AF71FB6
MKGPRPTLCSLVAVIGLLAAGCADDRSLDETQTPETEQTAPATTTDEPAAEASVDEPAVSVVDVTVVGVAGYSGGELAGIVAREADGLVVGGFATRIDGDPFATTQRVLRPADPDQDAVSWPNLSDEAADIPPGGYVLSLWSDTGLSGATRWVPMNSDGIGLAGCVERFTVGEAEVTEIVVGGDARSSGASGLCVPAIVLGDPVVESAPSEVASSDRTEVDPPFADAGFVERLLVWRDEFLAVGRTEPPRPLPNELPAAIAEQFPQEIQDLFTDGLPGTLNEAIVVIEDAGMMSEVSEAVASIPGAREAILAELSPTWLFARSADGVAWETLQATMPDEITQVFDVAAWGERLVVVGGHWSADSSFGSTEVVVAWSDDLASWTTARVAPERPPDLPDGAHLNVWDASVDANELGWMVAGYFGVHPGDEELPTEPSPELGGYLHDGGWGPVPRPTWWFSPWTGDPVITEPVDPAVAAVGDGVTVATDAGFVHIAHAIRFTDDGTTWRTQAVLAIDVDVDGWRTSVSQPLADGFVLVVDGPTIPLTVARLDARGELWIPIEVPDLPTDLMDAFDGSGYLFNAGVHYSDGFESWIVATPDGWRWHVEPLGSPDPVEYEPRVAALHDDILLFGSAHANESWSVITFRR